MRKQRLIVKGEIKYLPRKTKEYYKIVRFKKKPKRFPIIKCNYNGDTYAIYDSKIKKVKLRNYLMPF